MSRLLLRTRELMEACPLPLATLSIKSAIPYHWLTAFKYKQSPNPGIMYVERLYEYLSGQPIGLDCEPFTAE